MQSRVAVLIHRANAIPIARPLIVLGVALAIAAASTMIGLTRPGVSEDNSLVVGILNGPGVAVFVALKMSQWALLAGAAAFLDRRGSPVMARVGLLVMIAYTLYLALNNIVVIAGVGR